jgi:hypothetical protein
MRNKDWFPFKRMPAMGHSSYHASNGNVYAKQLACRRQASLTWNYLEVGINPALRSPPPLLIFLLLVTTDPKSCCNFR